MSWYNTREQAERACVWKRKEYDAEFKVVEEDDPRIGKMYWANRVIEEVGSSIFI